MTESLPLSIELSSLQRQVLEVIVLKGTSIQGQAWREQIILLWEQGISASEIAQELEIDITIVHRLRQKWLSSAERLAKAEKKVHDATTDMISEVVQILDSGKELPRSTSITTATAIQKKQKKRTEPPQELSPAAKAIIEIIHNKPRAYGINRSNWDLQSVAKAFEQQYGQSISRTTVSRYIKESGYSWKKSRKVLMSPDPNYREKVELLLKTLQSLKADEMFFFIDELGPMQVKRYGGRCYTPKGQTPTHPQNPHSKGSITIYGALSATTNQMTWFYGDTKDTAGIIDLVEILFNQYYEKSRIYITWDAASWHGANKLVEWVDNLNTETKAAGTGPIIDFVPLPSSAQFLDVIEAVFSGMKRAVIHFSDYQMPEEMKEAISQHFRERNEFFRDNPKRVGNKIWEVDFFYNHNNILSGNYREW